MDAPLKYFLCRIRAEPDGTDGSTLAPRLVSTHGYVWAETPEHAARLVLGTRAPAIPLPKGRPPVNTSLCMLSEAHVNSMQTAAAESAA